MILFGLAKRFMPHIGVLDGYVCMEGRGPVDGDPVKMGIAVAGTDVIAVDAVGAALMGIEPSDIGYLYYCSMNGLGRGNLKDIEIVGNTSLEENTRKFRMHPEFERQLGWKQDK